MVTRASSNRRRRVALIVLVLAVLLPSILFLVVQYRSLDDLENKTRAAVQDTLRQTLHAVATRTKERLEELTIESLGRFQALDVEKEPLDEIESTLTGLKQSHPEIDLAFLVVHCPCQKKQFAVFATADAVHRITGDHFKTRPEARAIIDRFDNASLLRGSSGIPQEAVFEQSPCELFPGTGGGSGLLVFLPLPSDDPNAQIGFAGFALKSSFLREDLVPELIPEVLTEAYAGGREVPVISVLDENNREVYSSGLRSGSPELTSPFLPVFRNWKLGIGFTNTTVATLARRQFRQNLLILTGALLLLVLGLALAVRATRREQKLVDAKETFVSNVSHELKTPLALIQLFGETLEMGRVKDDREMRDYGRIINRESTRLSQLINNILDFSRIEAGRREYWFLETDVGDLVEEVFQTYEHQLKSSAFTLSSRIEPDLPPVLSDREALIQAILNLINNAARYSSSVKTIEVNVEKRGQWIAIEVVDSGIGIPASEQQKIFEKFYRVSNGLVHDSHGSGLGLTIVKHIIEAHRGQVLVDSTPGQGSRFTIVLPISSTVENPVTGPLEPDRAGARGYTIAENPHHRR